MDISKREQKKLDFGMIFGLIVHYLLLTEKE